MAMPMTAEALNHALEVYSKLTRETLEDLSRSIMPPMIAGPGNPSSILPGKIYFVKKGEFFPEPPPCVEGFGPVDPVVEIEPKVPKRIDEMTFADYQRGVAACFDTFRIF